MTKPPGAFSAKTRPENVTAIRVTERNIIGVLGWMQDYEDRKDINRPIEPGDFLVHRPMQDEFVAMTLEEFYSEYHIA